MAAFERVKSGIPGLDEALDNIRLGDNVVWNVTNLNEFSYFVDPYVKQAKEDNRNLIYIRFANHHPLIEMTEEDFRLLEIEENNPETEFCMIERDGIKIYKVNPYNQFETFTLEVHRIIEKEGFDAFYVFDCLSDLQAVWSTDLMMGNFFKVTCPFLFQLVKRFMFLHLKYGTDILKQCFWDISLTQEQVLSRSCRMVRK